MEQSSFETVIQEAYNLLQNLKSETKKLNNDTEKIKTEQTLQLSNFLQKLYEIADSVKLATSGLIFYSEISDKNYHYYIEIYRENHHKHKYTNYNYKMKIYVNPATENIKTPKDLNTCKILNWEYQFYQNELKNENKIYIDSWINIYQKYSETIKELEEKRYWTPNLLNFYNILIENLNDITQQIENNFKEILMIKLAKEINQAKEELITAKSNNDIAKNI